MIMERQYRIRYTVPTANGNKDIKAIICNKYELQININRIIAKKDEGYEFIGLDDRIINPNYINNIDNNYGWDTIFNF